MEDPIHIGFLGGCINNQKGIAKDEFYYEVFSMLLQDRPHHQAVSIYLTFDTMVEKAERFMDKNNLDMLFLVIRQFPLMPLHKPFIKYENQQGGVSWALHPALWQRKLQWSKKLTEYHTLNEYVYKKKSRFGLRDLNLLAGKLMGLYRWAPAYVMQELVKVADLCARKNVQLIVLSTQQFLTSLMGNIACKKTSYYIEEQCAKQDIHYVNIIHLGEEHFAKDKVHFSADCHRFIANVLYDAFETHTFANIVPRAKMVHQH